MSTKIGRMLRDWKYWRKARKLESELYPPTPEPKLNAFETFLHLKPWQRVACIASCFLAYVLCIQPTFTANVAPHFMAIVGQDGHFNVHEFIQTLTLSSFVIILTASPLLMMRAPWSGKIGIAVMAFFIAYTTLDNACNVQEEGRATKNDAPRQRADRIVRLEAEITSGDRAFQQVPAHEYVLATEVKTAEAALETLKKSANEECHRGLLGNTRGPKCEEWERKRDTKAGEVEKLQHNADLTQRATDIEVALSQLRRDRKAEGAAPEITGTELERFPALLADFGVPMGFAKALSDHHPEIVATTQELIAWFGSPAAVAFVFWLFGLLTCSKTEAEKRVHEVAKMVGEDHAARAVAAANQNEDREHEIACAADPIEAEIFEPDHAAALGIEGEDFPAHVENPRNELEAMSAAFLKADKSKKPRRAPKKTPAHDSSVVLWAKERTFTCPGRHLWSDVATPDYREWCADRNLEPVSPQRFGIVMRREVLLDKENGAERRGGKTKYFDIGLNAAGLKVVAGGRA